MNLFGGLKFILYLCKRYQTYKLTIMESTTKKRTREEVRAAFRETMRKKKERMEENLRRMEELDSQGFFV